MSEPTESVERKISANNQRIRDEFYGARDRPGSGDGKRADNNQRMADAYNERAELLTKKAAYDSDSRIPDAIDIAKSQAADYQQRADRYRGKSSRS
jgi:hypothetical protein